MKNVHGGEIVARMLAAEGVETVFGIIDGTYFGLYSNFEKFGIRLITPRHETSAAHMAAAYARRTGRLGVCIASNGPGVANILPGVAVENGEGNRVLLITSCRRPGIIYPDRGGTYQYFNQVAVTKPMTKWSGAATSRERIPELMRRALRTSYSGRPGVVHLDIPESILNGKDDFDPAEVRPPATYRRTSPIAPDSVLVKEAANLLRHAQQPLIHAGSGIIHARAYDELKETAERLNAPVSTSWAARGVLNEGHRCAVPMTALDLNNRVRNDADVVLALGTRFGETDWWGKAPYWRRPNEQKTIQVDIDDAILGVNKPVELAVLADVGRFLQALSEELRRSLVDAAQLEARGRALDNYRTLARKNEESLQKKVEKKPPKTGLHPGAVPQTCQALLPRDTVWVYDGGNTTIWANFYQKQTIPGSVLSTFKFGMLGAGVAQAIGAKAADPNRTVCCLIGDGAMGFHMQEIETSIRAGLPVIYLVFCDKQWGMVKMNQQFALKPIKTFVRKSLREDETINADLSETQFDKVAEAMGAYGERVSSPDQLEPALLRAKEANRTAVLHLDVDPVAHMWAPGLMAFKDMHLEPKG